MINEYDSHKFNCNTNRLNAEGYYIKTSYTDSLRELVEREKRKRIQTMVETNKEINDDAINRAIELDFQQNTEYMDRVKLMKKSIQIARLMRKRWNKNKSDFYVFKNNKEILGLKYEYISTRINFIQISVIVVSTIITLFETLYRSSNISYIPIILSTYIGLILSISRFYKLDDIKEVLCKLDESISYCMGRLRHHMRDIERLKPLTADLTMDMLLLIEKKLDDQTKDGLEETIGICQQKYDLAISISEKVKYKNILLKITLDKYIVESHNDNMTNNKDSMSLSKYKTLRCWLCTCNLCKRTYIDVEGAYLDAETLKYKNKHDNIVSTSYNSSSSESDTEYHDYSQDHIDISSIINPSDLDIQKINI
jgi:hypothetical protein